MAILDSLVRAAMFYERSGERALAWAFKAYIYGSYKSIMVEEAEGRARIQVDSVRDAWHLWHPNRMDPFIARAY